MVIESISPEWSVFGKEEVSQKPEQIELGIHPQLRDLLPPLTETEYEKLEKSLLKKGCYDPIKTWRGYILDGHNRYGLCLKHNIPFQVQDCTNDKGLETTQDALLWIIENQQSRRNLKPYQMYVLEEEKQKILVGVGKKGFRSDQWKDLNIKKELRTSPPIGGENTSPYYQIAKNMGMGHNTYTKCKYVDKHGTEEQKKSLIQGKTSLDNIYKKISEEKRIEAQDGRRNITQFKYTEKEIRRNDLKLRNEAKERQKRKPIGEKSVALNSGRQNDDRSDRTDRKLAEKAGVSHDTIHKTRYVMEKADKELLDQMRSGKAKVQFKAVPNY